jgi:putative ABC transport system permease protein
VLKNYLLTAYKVFIRRKVFTGINLLGIVLTLTVLITATAVIDTFVHPTGPEKHSASFLEISTLSMLTADRENNWVSPVGYKFYDQYVRQLEQPSKIAIHSDAEKATSYLNGEKLSLQLMRTDGHYWEMLEFDFVEGRPLSQTDEEQGRFVAIISRETQSQIFGDQSALDQSITLNGQAFAVVGVVENVSAMELHASADIWVPISTNPSSLFRQELMGGFQVLLQSDSSENLKDIQQEYIEMLQNNTYDGRRHFEYAYGGADTKFEGWARRLSGRHDSFESGSKKLLATMGMAALLFMLLPTVNLVNLNVSRMLERASEIGVRRSFGARQGDLVGQFVVENVLLTFVGGLIGGIFAAVILQAIETSGLIPHAEFAVNWRVFAYGFALVVIFGVLSGVYPAWKMSRLQPVQALKGEL